MFFHNSSAKIMFFWFMSKKMVHILFDFFIVASSPLSL